MYRGRVKPAFSDHDLRSGTMIPPLGFYPHTGSTLMDVCLHSFSSSRVVLISIPAIPTIQYFLQSNVIYIGGDSDAFHSRYPAPVTRVVSRGLYLARCQLIHPPDVGVRRTLTSLSTRLRPWTLLIERVTFYRTLIYSLYYYPCHP